MKVHICGVRGSTPAPGIEFVRYGGNTCCLALALDDGEGEAPPAPSVLLDAGTGLRRVTALLGDRPFEGTILLSHLHWDHVQGLPFFNGGDREGARVSLLLPHQEAEGGLGASGPCTAEALLAKMMSPPNFPIGPRQLRGAWTFAAINPGHLDLACGRGEIPAARPRSAGFSVEVREIPHKGGRTFGFRVSDGRSTLAYIPDHCPTVLGPGPDGWGEYHPAALELARGADVLFHDAHLLAEELAAEARFGHAAADYAVALGTRAGVKKVVLFHHRPDRTDEAIDALTRRFADAELTVHSAAEGEVLAL